MNFMVLYAVFFIIIYFSESDIELLQVIESKTNASESMVNSSRGIMKCTIVLILFLKGMP